MPKELSTDGTATISSRLSNSKSKKTYAFTSGNDLLAATSLNGLIYGNQGTGKTYIVIHLLLLGFKVVYLNTDFGKSGVKTIKNWFHDNPDKASLLANMRDLQLDLDGMMAFARNPESVMPDIYDWDPDFLFWDGCTAFQQLDLEWEICGGNYDHESADWVDWGKVKKGTIFPLMNLLAQHNIKTGKEWSKIVTTLEDEKIQKRKSASKAEKKDGSDIIEGSETKGPMLDTTARDLAGAGFDLVLRATKKVIGQAEAFEYVTVGNDLMVKQRGFGLPAKVKADFSEVFKTYIGPKIGWRAK